jgi:hypothetical protein
VEKEAVMTTLEGEVLERDTYTLILRQPPPRQPPPRQPPPRQPPPRLPPHAGAGEPVKASGLAPTEITPDGLIKRPDMIAVFMFSAAIWAMHRIHWDTPYAQFEGLPLPVIPGWMLASYLAQLAEMRAPAGGRLRRIAVRYKGMAHPGDTLACAAVAAGGGGTDLTLTMTNQSGVEVASGQASYG